MIKKVVINLKRLVLFLIISVQIISLFSPNIYAATRGQREDALRSSEWTDGESSVCSPETAVTQSANISTPGNIFMIGDSIGEGLAPELPNDLKTEDGWGIQSNNRVGRPLAEGINIAAAEKESVKSAQYILVILGANPDAKLNGSGIQEMVEAIRSAPSNVPIVWLGINVSRQDLVSGASDFNRLLKSSSQIRYIENTVAPGPDQLHPNSYGSLSDLVSETFKSGITANSEDQESPTSCVCNFGNPTGLNVDNNLSLGSEGQERRISLIKLLIGDYNLTAEQAAGVVGNFMVESGGEHLPPDVNQGDTEGSPPDFSGGYGWAQWTGGRQRSFIDFAIEAGFMASESVNATDAANYAYLKKELDEGYKETINDLKKQSNPEDAAVSFERTFEKAGKPALEKRKAAARKAFDEYASGASSGGVSSTGSGNACIQGSAAIVGDSAFPLITTKANILNKGMFSNGTSDQGGHPYIAYDIITQENIPVAAFLSGKVTQITQDRCPGRLISVYNSESNLTISYLHLAFDNHAELGDELLVGQQLGLVGAASNGCGTIHLHIDAAEGSSRPGCSRLSCPDANKKKFRDIGVPLFDTFQKLAE